MTNLEVLEYCIRHEDEVGFEVITEDNQETFGDFYHSGVEVKGRAKRSDIVPKGLLMFCVEKVLGKPDLTFVTEPRLVRMRRKLAEQLRALYVDEEGKDSIVNMRLLDMGKMCFYKI